MYSIYIYVANVSSSIFSIYRCRDGPPGEAIDIVTTRPYDMGDQAVGLLAKESWDRHLDLEPQLHGICRWYIYIYMIVYGYMGFSILWFCLIFGVLYSLIRKTWYHKIELDWMGGWTINNRDLMGFDGRRMGYNQPIWYDIWGCSTNIGKPPHLMVG